MGPATRKSMRGRGCDRFAQAALRSCARSSFLPVACRRSNATSAVAALRATACAPKVSPFAIIEKDLEQLSGDLQNLVQSDHPELTAIAEWLLCGTEGKRVRPSLVLLMSRACAGGGEPTPKQKRLAEITELIHTASLLHDDVLDLSESRRGRPTAHVKFGNKAAVLGGDFLLARASIELARLDQPLVIDLMSEVLEELVKGEIMQMRDSWEFISSMDHYMEKTFSKTGALTANSCKSAAVLGEHSPEYTEIAFEYGRHVGMAFQLVDDLLDLNGDNTKLGKSAQADLKQGVVTAPLLFALEENKSLAPLMQRKFAHEGDVQEAYALIARSDAAERTRAKAEEHCHLAVEWISRLPPSGAVDSLAVITEKVLNREK